MIETGNISARNVKTYVKFALDNKCNDILPLLLNLTGETKTKQEKDFEL